MVNTQTIKKTKDFADIYQNGISAANRLLVVYIKPLDKFDFAGNKLGVSVNKKVGKAVKRNRIKRIIKESYKLFECHLKFGYSIIVVARAEAGKIDKDYSFSLINKALYNLFARHKIVCPLYIYKGPSLNTASPEF